MGALSLSPDPPVRARRLRAASAAVPAADLAASTSASLARPEARSRWARANAASAVSASRWARSSSSLAFGLGASKATS
jgi:hypothetical protein